MASEDVIELGSSDEEAEPAPKKKKPMPNAMVDIPSKLSGITIKPAKFNLSSIISSNPCKSVHIPKTTQAKPIVICKTNVGFNNNTNRLKSFPKSVCVPVIRNTPKMPITMGSTANKFSINPISVAKNLKPELVIKKIAPNRRPKLPVTIQGPKLLNCLPPGITIKPVASASGISNRSNRHTLKNRIGDVLTVEIEDEEVPESSIASPLWYIRPEEQKSKSPTKENNEYLDTLNNKIKLSLEEQNNKEPETPNFVEITIEDSPVKPLHFGSRCELGKELAITIEDSPVKPIRNKEESNNSEKSSDKVPQSKKKLDYPNDSTAVGQVVEIEIDLREAGELNHNKNGDPSTQDVELNIGKQVKLKEMSDIEKTVSKKELNVIDSKNDTREFHPVYQNFIDTCFKLENSEDMKKIVDKKIKAYYNQCHKEYVESDEFIDIVASKIVLMEAAPDKMYLCIKDVVDELNLQRKMAKTLALKTTDTVQELDTFGENSEYDSKRQRQIRKLEKTIKKLHRAIKILEEQEVEFEDEDDSVYLLTERYKERMVRVHAKFCQLTNTKMPSEPYIHLEVRPGRPAGPVRKLEKWINKKVPIGSPLPFPDFHDVLCFVKEANKEDKLGWNEIDIMEEARDLFTRCGKKLQRRRQENEWRLAVSRISYVTDPAAGNVDLMKQLDENKSMAAKREFEVINKFVDRQDQLKLVADEIGNKEAEESPIESDEEEPAEDSLVNKVKRKERLKRLLREKNRKTEEKENNPEEESNVKCNVTSKKEIDSEAKYKDNSTEINISVQSQDVSHTTHLDNCVSENVDENTTESRENNERVSDEKEFESDVDELHLLQKLHSENESGASSVESSDSDTPIEILDTQEYDSDIQNINYVSDVSIENSSYSESGDNGDELSNDQEKYLTKSKVGNLIGSSEVEYTANNSIQTGSEDIVENILLASSEDETCNKNIEYDGTCINLKDDDITISETSIEVPEKEKVYNEQKLLENNVSRLNSGLYVNDNSAIVDKETLKEGNNSILDCMQKYSDVDDATKSGDLVKDDMHNTNSVDSFESQIEQNVGEQL